MVDLNFFILGAPKCGTTSLAVWLKSHPDIFMAEHKEPHHFNIDHNFVVYGNKEDYEALFEKASTEKVIGEASVWYLYSSVAVPSIERKYHNVKYVVCVRHPVMMAMSLFLEQRYATNENVDDFYAAWQLSPRRRIGGAVTKWCREPKHLDYQRACSLGEQISRLYEIVPKERVKIVFLEDVKKDPLSVYLDLLSFLNLKDDGRRVFDTENSAKAVKYVFLKRFVRILGKIRAIVPIKRRMGILNKINEGNKKKLEVKPSLSSEQYCEILGYYRNDIDLLARLSGKDLSDWLRTL